MADIIDINKKIESKKLWHKEIKKAWKTAENLTLIESKVENDVELIRLTKLGYMVVNHLLIEIYVALLKKIKNPDYLPSSRKEADEQFTVYVQGVMEDYDGPIPFLLDNIRQKAITEDGTFDLKAISELAYVPEDLTK